MSEELVVGVKNDNPIILKVSGNPFIENSVAPAPPVEKLEAPNPVEPTKAEPPATTTAQDDETFDADEYLKKETGWETWEAAKAAKAELDELKKSPKTGEFKFANDVSERLFNAIKEGKEDDIYDIINAKKQIEAAEKLDATKSKDAARIIKTDLQYKHKDLTPDEVDFMFDEKYSVPDKPKRNIEHTDEDYAEELSKWERQVQMIEKRMTIDAKLAKPELTKFKSELVLPELPKPEPVQQAPSQESLDAQKAIRQSYEKAVESEFSKFDGFNTKVKDESVEIPISFKASDEEKFELKNLMLSMNVDDYFGSRWFKDGVANVQKMMSDLYLLEKGEKVLSAISNNAADAHFKNYQKSKLNVNLNTGNGQKTELKPDEKTQRQLEYDYIWKNG